MKKLIISSLVASALLSTSPMAAMITNGNFATCDLTGWSVDSDASPLVDSDFSVADTGAGCAATMTVDTSDAGYNLLYQELDLTANAGSELWLNFDFSVDSELTDQEPGFADYFDIALHDGMGGFYDHNMELGSIFETVDINGPASYTQSFLLDEAFYNQTGWYLEFQIATNWDFSPSSFTLNSVSFSEVASVPAPATLPMFLAGLIGISVMRGRKSNVKKELSC